MDDEELGIELLIQKNADNTLNVVFGGIPPEDMPDFLDSFASEEFRSSLLVMIGEYLFQ